MAKAKCSGVNVQRITILLRSAIAGTVFGILNYLKYTGVFLNLMQYVATITRSLYLQCLYGVVPVLICAKLVLLLFDGHLKGTKYDQVLY